MAEEIAIRAEGLGKKYRISHESAREPYVALRDVIAGSVHGAIRAGANALQGRSVGRHVREDFWALKDLSFEIRRGDVVGIIGRNGAGKTTLLKILARITEPTEGRVTIAGRVASLLEVGTGFHPELSGRENIFLNGAILGMTRAEIKRKFDDIVAFAEMEKFLDTPVKRYSSGMYVRLAFAVAAHLEPEILVVDEVLAVGDAAFQKRCLGKMSEIAGSGRTVLFVSHNLTAVQALCTRAIYLVSGTLACEGEAGDVIATYLKQQHTPSGPADHGETVLDKSLALERVRVVPATIRSGDAVEVEFQFRAEDRGQIRECAILIYSAEGIRVAISDVRESGHLPFNFGVGRFAVRATIAALPFVEGNYGLGMYLVTREFAGNLLEIGSLTVATPRSAFDFAPYPASARGIVVVDSTASIGAVQRADAL